MTKKRSTNTEFVTELMEHSKHGALMQAFILQALENAASMTLACADQLNGNSFISKEAWLGCAQEVHDKIKGRFDDSVIEGEAA